MRDREVVSQTPAWLRRHGTRGLRQTGPRLAPTARAFLLRPVGAVLLGRAGSRSRRSMDAGASIFTHRLGGLCAASWIHLLTPRYAAGFLVPPRRVHWTGARCVVKGACARRTRALHGDVVPISATSTRLAGTNQAARWCPAPVTAPACSGSTERPKRNRRAGRRPCRIRPKVALESTTTSGEW